MRHPKRHINYQRRQQVVYTVVFTMLLIALIALMSAGCNPNRDVVFSRSKFDVYTGPTKKNGKPVIRARNRDRTWFWQQKRKPEKPTAP